MNPFSETVVLVWPVVWPILTGVNEPHVTIAFLGKIAKEKGAFQKVIAGLTEASEVKMPGEVKVIGHEQFGPEDGKVWVAELDPTNLVRYQSLVLACLANHGIANASDFKDFRPHVTHGPTRRLDSPPSYMLGYPELWWGGKQRLSLVDFAI